MKDEYQDKRMLSVVIDRGAHKLMTPNGFVIGHLTSTRIIHDIDLDCYPLAMCFFSGFIGGESEPRIMDTEKYQGPRLKDGKLFSPAGELILTESLEIHGGSKDELLNYKARSIVKLNYDTKHK